MNAFVRSVSNMFRGGLKAFQTFPAAIGCALGFAVVTIIRIELDWPQQEPYNFLFNCLHWALALGAVFSLAAITAAQSRANSKNAFAVSNLLGIAAAAVAFLGLYLLGGIDLSWNRYLVLADLSVARVGMAMLVCLILFVILAGYPKDRSDFPSALFMTLKAFFIALIYGGVLMAGSSGVAGAIQSLLYHDMSSKVYQYIGTIVGFLTFTIFVGYFPDFRKGSQDAHRETAQKQPRFIEVLFGFILIPIVLALTVVLLIWAGKTVLSGMQVPFVQLSGIAASYTIGGLWLHAMTVRHESGLAKTYRLVYPLASAVILAFEAWAVVTQLQSSGLKTTEYYFILVWLLAAAGVVLLVIQKFKTHAAIAAVACVLAIVSVLPVIGYHDLSVSAQTTRVETLLKNEGMLQNGQLTPAVTKPEQDVRAAITDAVSYLAGVQNARLPAWFSQDLNSSTVFLEKFGFEQTWVVSGEEYPQGTGDYRGTYLSLAAGAVDISGYTWAINPQVEYNKGQGSVTFDGAKGTYQVDWSVVNGGIPTLRIQLNGAMILEQDLRDYIDAVTEKYPPGDKGNMTAPLSDMSLRLETSEIDALLVFRTVQVSVDVSNDVITYWFDLEGLYLKEKT